MGVKIKDRNKEVEMFRLAVTLSGANINYETADLVYNVFKVLQEKGDKLDLADAVKLEREHELRWFDYYKPKKEIEFESDTDMENEQAKWFCESCEYDRHYVHDDGVDRCGYCGEAL